MAPRPNLRSQVHLMSSAVSSLPQLLFTPCRSWKRMNLLAGSSSNDCASLHLHNATGGKGQLRLLDGVLLLQKTEANQPLVKELWPGLFVWNAAG